MKVLQSILTDISEILESVYFSLYVVGSQQTVSDKLRKKSYYNQKNNLLLQDNPLNCGTKIVHKYYLSQKRD